MRDLDAPVHVLILHELDNLIENVVHDKVIIFLRYLAIIKESKVE